MFVIDIPYLNLNQIYNSGQVPRWIKLRESKYVIVHKGKVLNIEQKEDRTDFTNFRFIFSCTEEEFFTIWFDYFDLRIDYFEENKKVKKIDNKFKIIANRGFGLHILNQDPFEVYVFSKIVLKVGYDKASSAVNHIAQVCGTSHVQSMGDAGRVTWYEFPSPNDILENFDNLKRMGKVNSWLKKLCLAIINDGFDISSTDNELFKLFAMNDTNAFPLIGIEEFINNEFECEPKEFADWYLDDIENKGLIYLNILHHVKNPPKEVPYNGAN